MHGYQQYCCVDITYIPFSFPVDVATEMYNLQMRGMRIWKRQRYENLASDIEENGYRCSNLPLEIGSRGNITARNRETMIHLCHTLKIGKFSNVIKCSSKLALLGSYSIFIGRNSSDWSGSGLLKP